MALGLGFWIRDSLHVLRECCQSERDGHQDLVCREPNIARSRGDIIIVGSAKVQFPGIQAIAFKVATSYACYVEPSA